MADLGSTQTGLDIVAALRKRLTTQAHFLTDQQLLTLMVDVMTVINADAANAVTHAGQEIAKNPQRPFVRHV